MRKKVSTFTRLGQALRDDQGGQAILTFRTSDNWGQMKDNWGHPPIRSERVVNLFFRIKPFYFYYYAFLTQTNKWLHHR